MYRLCMYKCGVARGGGRVWKVDYSRVVPISVHKKKIMSGGMQFTYMYSRRNKF